MDDCQIPAHPQTALVVLLCHLEQTLLLGQAGDWQCSRNVTLTMKQVSASRLARRTFTAGYTMLTIDVSSGFSGVALAISTRGIYALELNDAAAAAAGLGW